MGPRGEAGTSENAAAAAAAARERKLATPWLSNRARVESGVKTYSVAPRSNITGQAQFARPAGASTDDAFRRMKARQIAKTGGASMARR